MKVSKIDVSDVVNYLNAYEEDYMTVEILLKASKSYVKSYTGLTDEQLDKHEDIAVAVMVLCNEMYENRTFSVDNDKVNVVIKSILDMYSVNLL